MAGLPVQLHSATGAVDDGIREQAASSYQINAAEVAEWVVDYLKQRIGEIQEKDFQGSLAAERVSTVRDNAAKPYPKVKGLVHGQVSLLADQVYRLPVHLYINPIDRAIALECRNETVILRDNSTLAFLARQRDRAPLVAHFRLIVREIDDRLEELAKLRRVHGFNADVTCVMESLGGIAERYHSGALAKPKAKHCYVGREIGGRLVHQLVEGDEEAAWRARQIGQYAVFFLKGCMPWICAMGEVEAGVTITAQLQRLD